MAMVMVAAMMTATDCFCARTTLHRVQFVRVFVGALASQSLKCMLHLFKNLVAVANCMHVPAPPSTKFPLAAAKA